MRHALTEEDGTTESGRNKKLYQMLLDAIPSSVLMIDRDMRIMSANRNFLVKSRRHEADTLGYRLGDIFPSVILNHMKIPLQIRQVFDTNMPTEGHRMSYRSPGLPMRIYYYRLLPFSWKGSVENVMLLMDDVTEQIRLSEEVRRVERHLASIIESASDIILSTDTNGKILSWNPAAEKLSGYTYEEVRGRYFFKFIEKEYRQDMETVFLEMKSGRGSKMAEWEFITKAGTRIHVSWVFSPMKNENFQTMGVVSVGRDLTERKKLESQLLQSQKFAALGVMAGGIAHELRNPLAICSSAAQFLQEDGQNSGFRKECAEKIHTGIQRASIIIENLLRFARPSGNPRMQRIDLNCLVDDTLQLVGNQARIQKIELRIALRDQPVWVDGNESLLQQVLINLFLNAIRAMPDGGVLSLSVIETENSAAIRMRDTGHGISDQDIDKIFDPFYTTSSVGKGTGLGLAITYSIVRQHLGHIEVDSTRGIGTEITVTLPGQSRH